jgi:hypothetical protein
VFDESYKLDWGGADRVSVTFTGKALVSVESGEVAIGKYVEEVAYVAPVEADPEAEPPVEAVEEVEYVAPKPSKDGLVIHWNRPPYGVVVEGTVGFYNVSNAADGSRADVRIQPYTE